MIMRRIAFVYARLCNRPREQEANIWGNYRQQLRAHDPIMKGVGIPLHFAYPSNPRMGVARTDNILDTLDCEYIRRGKGHGRKI